MPANKFKIIRILVLSFLVCMATFTKSLLRALFRIMNREIADRYIDEWARRMLWVVGVKVDVVGEMPTFQKDRCYIYMCNHTSLYDIPISFVALPPSVRMLAKIELKKIWIFGTVLRLNEFIFIDRKNREQAREDLEAAARRMRDGIRVWVAPEGTRSRTGALLPFKKGVFRLAKETKAIIIPVTITGAAKILPAKSWRFTPNQTVTVNIGAPIDVEDPKYSDLTTLMQEVRQHLAHALPPPS